MTQDERSKAAAILGRLGGRAATSKLTPQQRRELARKGGLAAASKMTPEQRKERATKASRAAHSKPAKDG